MQYCPCGSGRALEFLLDISFFLEISVWKITPSQKSLPLDGGHLSMNIAPLPAEHHSPWAARYLCFSWWWHMHRWWGACLIISAFCRHQWTVYTPLYMCWCTVVWLITVTPAGRVKLETRDCYHSAWWNVTMYHVDCDLQHCAQGTCRNIHNSEDCAKCLGISSGTGFIPKWQKHFVTLSVTNDNTEHYYVLCSCRLLHYLLVSYAKNSCC